MRILHVHSGNLYGGVENLLTTLARCRDAYAGLEPEFALCFEGRLSSELQASGAPVHLLGNVRVSRPLTVLRARHALRDLLRRKQFDAVICHSVWPQAIFGPVVRGSKLPLVFWLHDTPDGGHGWLERWARMTPPDLALCNSEFTLGNLPVLYPQVRGAVVYSPVAPAETHYSELDRSELRAEFDTPEDAVVIVQVGRWEPYKGRLLHMDGLGRLRDVPSWVCWQVGSPQRPHEVRYYEEVQARASRLGIGDRVRFVGWQPDVNKVLAAADIFCQPNAAPEPLGVVFLEALHARLPVVTTAMGGPREIVDESRGILVPPGDAGALSEALGRLIRDQALRIRLGAAGPARARQLSDPATHLQRLSDAVASAVARNSRDAA